MLSLLRRNPPKRIAARKHRDATALATATLRAAAPMAMHIQLAHTLVAMRAMTNHARQYSSPSLRPIMPYVMNPKKNGGSTRIGRRSKRSMEVKYALVP